jgi:hypothetical protein
VTIRNSLPFAMTPEWLLDSTVSDKALRLYAVLARYADKEHHAHPSRRKLAERMHCSPDSVDRVLKELQMAGAIEVDNRFDEDGHQTSNDYILRPGGRTDAEGGSRMDAEGVAAPVRHRTKAIEREPSEREKNSLSVRSSFDAFYAVYPRHEGRAVAVKAFDKAMKKTGDLEIILAGAIRYRDDPNRESGWTLHPSTWLNQERWNDDPLPVRRHRRRGQGEELLRQALEG